jgi:hypothetical protein
MFENRNQPLISRRRFAARVAFYLGIAFAIDALAVAIGAIGFHLLEGMNWLVASVNGAMVITGNGLISQLRTPGGRLFSIFEAFFGVLAFVSVAGVILAPVLHRLMHTFHLDVPGEPR